MAARCLTLVKHRLGSKWAGYGKIHTAGKFRGLDLEVPHSELAMHTRAAGKKLVAWACKPSGRECAIVFQEPKGGCGDTFGLPGEVLPFEIRRAMGGEVARGLGRHRSTGSFGAGRSHPSMKLYKGRAITKLFPSGYYEIYSDVEGRFLKFDSVADAKAQIDRERRRRR